MRIHEDWFSPSFSMRPVAEAPGPFPRRAFLELWWDQYSRPSDRLLIAEEPGAGLVPLVIRNGRVEFAGEPDLCDYHSPLGPAAAVAVEEVLPEVRGRRFRFDSLPAEAAEVVAEGLAAAGAHADPVRHEVAAVLTLDTGYAGWLDGIGKKERHEVRRKLRRCTADLGELGLVRDAGAFSAFVAMHRSAPGDKGAFLTEQTEMFFAALLADGGAVLDVLTASGRPVAAAFGFEDDEGYYLYNSAYESDVAASSPGIALLAHLIEARAGAGVTRFDFLKGDEPYKFRLGAAPRPLYALEGILP